MKRVVVSNSATTQTKLHGTLVRIDVANSLDLELTAALRRIDRREELERGKRLYREYLPLALLRSDETYFVELSEDSWDWESPTSLTLVLHDGVYMPGLFKATVEEMRKARRSLGLSLWKNGYSGNCETEAPPPIDELVVVYNAVPPPPPPPPPPKPSRRDSGGPR